MLKSLSTSELHALKTAMPTDVRAAAARDTLLIRASHATDQTWASSDYLKNSHYIDWEVNHANKKSR